MEVSWSGLGTLCQWGIWFQGLGLVGARMKIWWLWLFDYFRLGNRIRV